MRDRAWHDRHCSLAPLRKFAAGRRISATDPARTYTAVRPRAATLCHERRNSAANVCDPTSMADSRVAAAVSHWAPRFVANGIDYNDFQRVTAAIETWDSWCAQWCQAASPHENLGRAALADNRCLSAGSHLTQAAVYYHFAKFMFVNDLGQMRAAHEAAVRCLNDALPHLDPPGERVEIPFDGVLMLGV